MLCPTQYWGQRVWHVTNVSSRWGLVTGEISHVHAEGDRGTGLGEPFTPSSLKHSVLDMPSVKTMGKKASWPQCPFLPCHNHCQTHLSLLKCVSIDFSPPSGSVARYRCHSWVFATPVGKLKSSFIFTLWPKPLIPTLKLLKHMVLLFTYLQDVSKRRGGNGWEGADR